MNKWKWVYNPFERVAGWKAFGIGIVILAATTVVGFFGNMVFYALEAKIVPEISWGRAFALQGLGLAVTVGVMYAAALPFARRTRFQDILGTVTLAKYPLLLEAAMALLFGKELASIDVEKFISNTAELADYTSLLVFGVISLILLVWEIALLFNAFRVSTSLKGVKCAVIFTIAMLITEIATISLVSAIYS